MLSYDYNSIGVQICGFVGCVGVLRSLDQLTHQNTAGAGPSSAPVSRYDQPTTRAAKMNLEP